MGAMDHDDVFEVADSMRENMKSSKQRDSLDELEMREGAAFSEHKPNRNRKMAAKKQKPEEPGLMSRAKNALSNLFGGSKQE